MNYNEILLKAKEAAMIAFKNCIPTPVIWQQCDLSDKPIGKPSKPDPEGECGGAYITGIKGRDPMENKTIIRLCLSLTKSGFEWTEYISQCEEKDKIYKLTKDIDGEPIIKHIPKEDLFKIQKWTIETTSIEYMIYTFPERLEEAKIILMEKVVSSAKNMENNIKELIKNIKI